MSSEKPPNATTFDLHPSQKDIYTDQLLNVDSPHYNIGGYIVLKGLLDKDKLKEAITAAPKVFDVFKMRFNFKQADFIFLMDETYQELEWKEIDFSKENAIIKFKNRFTFLKII